MSESEIKKRKYEIEQKKLSERFITIHISVSIIIIIIIIIINVIIIIKSYLEISNDFRDALSRCRDERHRPLEGRSGMGRVWT